MTILLSQQRHVLGVCQEVNPELESISRDVQTSKLYSIKQPSREVIRNHTSSRGQDSVRNIVVQMTKYGRLSHWNLDTIQQVVRILVLQFPSACFVCGSS